MALRIYFTLFKQMIICLIMSYLFIQLVNIDQFGAPYRPTTLVESNMTTETLRRGRACGFEYIMTEMKPHGSKLREASLTLDRYGEETRISWLW